MGISGGNGTEGGGTEQLRRPPKSRTLAKILGIKQKKKRKKPSK
jgi:hypothetical protein